MRKSDRRTTLILMGSARTDGDTAAGAEHLSSLCTPGGKVIALAPMALGSFNYARAPDDDFLLVATEIAGYDRIVLATPLYWYAMSGVMKTFFDRLTDLLVVPAKRPLGRALAGREVWALVVGTDPEPPVGLAEPFKLTASYFDMIWRGACYARSNRHGGIADDQLARIAELAAQMNATAAPTGRAP